MTKEDEILLSNIEDKLELCLSRDIMTCSNFLDARQKALAESLCNKRKRPSHRFYGGYAEAERTVVIFSPELDGFDESEDPLELLRVTHDGYKELTHGDYLGSLMAQGIKREILGDILVRKDGADIIVLAKMSGYLLQNYEKAGRINLRAEILPLKELIVPEARFEEKKDTVASLRLDNMVASAFSMSRSGAAEAISDGLVYVNGVVCQKTDRLLKEKDKLVLRGKGKVLLDSIGPLTRKDRTVVLFKKYI
ncbi:MAG: RNA-binding protein [Clostridiales bacterium]|nr:RNA-binding protein [Clostridiales bacterium]